MAVSDGGLPAPAQQGPCAGQDQDLRTSKNRPDRPCVQEFVALAQAMVDGRPTPEGPTPPELTSKQWSLLPPVVRDSTPSGEPC